MTALEIINELKAKRATAMLYINHARKESAFHPGGGEVYATPVTYADAMMARTDPALNIVQKTPHGELIEA